MFSIENLVKYLLNGLGVALAMYVVMRDTVTQREILTTAITAAIFFAILDYFSPIAGLGARVGTGVSLGMKLVGGEHEEEM